MKTILKKQKNKLIASKGLYDIEQYSTAVSTCYYAMFLCAKALLIDRNISPGKTHNGLLYKFKREFVNNDNFSDVAYTYIASTQALREESDYAAFDTITAKIAKERIDNAEIFIKECKKFVKI